MSGRKALVEVAQTWRSAGLRLGLHLGVMSVEKPLYRRSLDSVDPLDHIRLAADLGFAGITDNLLKSRPPEVQSAMGEELARLGLAMGTFNNALIAPGQSLPTWGHPDPAMDVEFAATIDASIEAGRRVNGHVITIILADASGADPEVQMQAFARRIHSAADRVAKAGMILGIETVSAVRMPGVLVRRIAQVRELIGAERHPGIGFLFDTGHVHEMDGDPVAAFDQSRDIRVSSIQIANVLDRKGPGTGDTDFTGIFGALKRCSYSGLVELEHYVPEDTAAAEVESLARISRIIGEL